MTPNAISASPSLQPSSQPAKRIIGLLAGQGELPRKIVAHCLQNADPLFMIAFEGQTDPDWLKNHPTPLSYAWVRLGAVGEILTHLKTHKVTHVVLAGALRRPSWSELKLDRTGSQWLIKIGLKAFGDDSLLTSALNLLKAEGFEILSAADLLADLLAPEGVLGVHQPTEADRLDIQRGQDVARLLGAADVGQSVVVQQGLVLGVEAIEGTEALLARCGLLRRAGPGGVLVKLAKPGQNRAADLPTIGVATVQQAQAAGLRGIAVEAGATQILDPEAVIQAADAAGLYLIGVPS